MAFTYKVITSKNKLKNDAVMQTATQRTRGNIPTRDVANRLQQLTSLSRGDVMNVLSHLGEVVAEYLQLGYSVNLHELGSFTPRISSHQVPEGEEFKPEHIRGLNMRFTPSVYIKEQLRKTSFHCETNNCPAPDDSTTPTEGSSPTTPPDNEGGNNGIPGGNVDQL